MNYLKFLFYIFLSSFVLIGLPSYAQDSAIETKIKELENQIQDLKIQMKILNKKNNTSVENELKFKIGPGFSVKHGENSFKIHGRMHYDWGFLPDIDEAKDPDIISKIRDVLKNGITNIKDPVSGKNMKVDSYSASAITQVYDKINRANKKKFVKLSLPKMAKLAMKFVK